MGYIQTPSDGAMPPLNADRQIACESGRSENSNDQGGSDQGGRLCVERHRELGFLCQLDRSRSGSGELTESHYRSFILLHVWRLLGGVSVDDLALGLSRVDLPQGAIVWGGVLCLRRGAIDDSSRFCDLRSVTKAPLH